LRLHAARLLLCTSTTSHELSAVLSQAKEITMRSLLVCLGIVVSSLVAVGVAAQSPDDSAAFVLRVDSEGSFFLADATAPSDENSVVAQAAAALNRNANVALVVEGDTAAPSQSVRRAAQLLQEAGAKRISFRTSDTSQR
jgi:biopolymer transport protein ExbD